MKYNPFLLEQWLNQNEGTEFNLGGSTGPCWRPRQLLALAGDGAGERILDIERNYAPTGGNSPSRSHRRAARCATGRVA
jgi:hypothetical protein